MAIDSKFQVLTKEALKDKIENLNSDWKTILILGDGAYLDRGEDADLENHLCVNAELLKEIITGNLRYEAQAQDNFLLDGNYYTLKNINGVYVPYQLRLVLDFIALLKKPYTVEFRDGSDILSTQTIYWNSKVTKPTDPTKSGYTFTGWSPATWDFNTTTLNNKSQLDTAGKLVFLALWTEDTYSYTFINNSSSVVGMSLTTESGESLRTLYIRPSSDPYTVIYPYSSLKLYIISDAGSGYHWTLNGSETISSSVIPGTYVIDKVQDAAPVEYYHVRNNSSRLVTFTFDGNSENYTLSSGELKDDIPGSSNTQMLRIRTSAFTNYYWTINGVNTTYANVGRGTASDPNIINYYAYDYDEYYYRIKNNSNKNISITIGSSPRDVEGNSGIIDYSDIYDSIYLNINTAPDSGYHWEVNGNEYHSDFQITGSTNENLPEVYTITMVADDSPSVEITCIEYNVTITAQDVAATATTANYSVNATKIIHYNNNTKTTSTIPASEYTVSGDVSFANNTTTNPITRTISVSINNPSSNLCSGSVTSASTTFTLAAADAPTPTCSTYTYYITNNGFTTMHLNGGLLGIIEPGQTRDFTSSSSSITYSIYWESSCYASFTEIPSSVGYSGTTITSGITFTYHDFEFISNSGSTTLTADSSSCSNSKSHTPVLGTDYASNEPTFTFTNINTGAVYGSSPSISNNSIVNGTKRWADANIPENLSTSSINYGVESSGLSTCSDSKSGTLSGAPEPPVFTSNVQITIRTAGNTAGFCRGEYLDGYINCPSGDYIQIAGNILDSGSIMANGYWDEELTPTFIITDYGYTGVSPSGEYEGYIPELTFPNGSSVQISVYRVGNASELC